VLTIYITKTVGLIVKYFENIYSAENKLVSTNGRRQYNSAVAATGQIQYWAWRICNAFWLSVRVL